MSEENLVDTRPTRHQPAKPKLGDQSHPSGHLSTTRAPGRRKGLWWTLGLFLSDLLHHQWSCWASSGRAPPAGSMCGQTSALSYGTKMIRKNWCRAT
jgi:hypothetical protein